MHDYFIIGKKSQIVIEILIKSEKDKKISSNKDNKKILEEEPNNKVKQGFDTIKELENNIIII